jgi:hypothetical protein
MLGMLFLIYYILIIEIHNRTFLLQVSSLSVILANFCCQDLETDVRIYLKYLLIIDQ